MRHNTKIKERHNMARVRAKTCSTDFIYYFFFFTFWVSVIRSDSTPLTMACKTSIKATALAHYISPYSHELALYLVDDVALSEVLHGIRTHVVGTVLLQVGRDGVLSSVAAVTGAADNHAPLAGCV